MNFFDLIYDIFYTIFGINQPPTSHKKFACLNGATLFFDEYTNGKQFENLHELFFPEEIAPLIRMPFPPGKDHFNKISSTINLATQKNISVIILLDAYFNDQSMKERINYIANKHKNVKFFEIFNELPWMSYPGEQLSGLDQLISKINEYTQIIHSLIPFSKVISMAPANSLQDMDYEDNWGGNNAVQLERLIKETDADIVGIHCYVDSIKQKYNFRKLMDNLNKWMKGQNKEIWITETGISGWNKHINFYYEWISRFVECLDAEKTIWYRQTIKSEGDKDSDFSLEIRDVNKHSPLWKELMD